VTVKTSSNNNNICKCLYVFADYKRLQLILRCMPLLSTDAAAPPGGLTVAGLYRLMSDSSSSILLMDVRSRDDFSNSHVKSTDCINVPADCLPLGSVTFVLMLNSFFSKFELEKTNFIPTSFRPMVE